MNAHAKFQKLMETHAPQPLTEAELSVELPHNVGAMTLAEVMRWIKTRAST